MAQRSYARSEVTRSEVLQKNERIKSMSSLCANVGAALMIAGSGRWFYTAIDGNTILRLLVGPVLIWIGLQILSLLEAESGIAA